MDLKAYFGWLLALSAAAGISGLSAAGDDTLRLDLKSSATMTGQEGAASPVTHDARAMPTADDVEDVTLRYFLGYWRGQRVQAGYGVPPTALRWPLFRAGYAASTGSYSGWGGAWRSGGGAGARPTPYAYSGSGSSSTAGNFASSRGYDHADSPSAGSFALRPAFDSPNWTATARSGPQSQMPLADESVIAETALAIARTSLGTDEPRFDAITANVATKPNPNVDRRPKHSWVAYGDGRIGFAETKLVRQSK